MLMKSQIRETANVSKCSLLMQVWILSQPPQRRKEDCIYCTNKNQSVSPCLSSVRFFHCLVLTSTRYKGFFFCIKYNALCPLQHRSFLSTGKYSSLVQSGRVRLITGLSRSHCERLEGLDCVIKQASVPPEGHRSRCSH